MRNQLTLYAIIFITATYSQIQKKTITGKVLFENNAIANVHIINQQTKQGTNTSNFGIFEIPVTIGDTLHFSHINYTPKRVGISEENLIADTLHIKLSLKIYQLEEITLQKPKDSIDNSEQNKAPIINAKTLNLPYAGTKGKKNYSVVKIRSGIVFSIDNFINFLNGNNKRRKRLKRITNEDDILDEIRNYFTDYFFINELNIKYEDINLFLNYCFKHNIIEYFNLKKYTELKILFVTQSISFLKNNTENSMIKK